METGAVVVTGASSGIGRATVLTLARRGWPVYGGVRAPGDGAALAAAAAACGVGPRVHPLLLDVTDVGSVAAAAARVSEDMAARGTRLAGLVNNAGIAVAGPVEEVPLVRLRAALEINVIGAVAVTQAFLPLLRARHGRIVNVSSVSGRLAAPFLGPYAASKFALEALSDALRLELRPWGIGVVLVEPGPVATPIWAKGEGMARDDRATLDVPDDSPYAPAIPTLIAAFRRAAERGMPPERVAAVIAAALAAPRPRARYLVARHPLAFVLLARVAPDGLRDAILARRGRGLANGKGDR